VFYGDLLLDNVTLLVLHDSRRGGGTIHARVYVDGPRMVNNNADSHLVDFMNLGADIAALTIWNGTELSKISHLRQGNE
jgi:hypothetical protein